MNFETENIEFKSQFTEDIYKEVIAFANTDGGIIYIGIDNDGNVIGITDVDSEYTRITNGIRDAIMPDVTMCVKFRIQDNKVVNIIVNEGTNKPYYLKKKGLKPSGVFIRQGSSSVQASSEQIRYMIKDSDGEIFEEMRSLEQNLTFEEAKDIFEHYGIEFSVQKYRALGIVQKNNDIYTNLGLVLSDQCPYTTKIAIFNDETCTEFRDSKEFKGSVLKQFEDSITYLSLCNKTISVINGIKRIDRQDYPEAAIREAFLNAIVHRDYSFSGSNIININDKKMEFISIGGLLPGLSTDDICIGISQPRNKNLAEVFHRLKLIESYGTGIRRIYKLYDNYEIQPKIEVTQNAFKIVLPNMNEEHTVVLRDNMLTPQMQKVFDFIRSNENATDADIEKLLGVKHTRMYVLLQQMKDAGLIKIEGRGKDKKYMIN